MAIAVIIGGTGLVGESLTQLCIESSFFKRVHQISRRLPSIQDKKLTVKLVEDFQLLSLDDFPQDAEDIYGFCCLGSTRKQAGSQKAFARVDYHFPVNFSALCRAKGARHLAVVSSMGASSWSPSFYLRTKGRMEAAIRLQNWQSCSILRPALLLGKRDTNRFGEDLAKTLAPFIAGRWAAIQAFDVAKAMVILAEKSSPGFNVYSSYQTKILASS